MAVRHRSVNALVTLCTRNLAQLLFHALKRASHPNSTCLLPSVQSELQSLIAELGHLANSSQMMVDAFADLVLNHAQLLHVNFYRLMGILFCNQNTKVIELDSAKLFQSSSMALEATLADFERLRHLTHIHISFDVLDLVCFDFKAALNNVAAIKGLKTLCIRGLSSVLDDDDCMFSFTSLLLLNSGSSLQTLDLSHSALSDECAESHLARLSLLTELHVDETRLTSMALNILLESLKSLNTLSAYPLIPDCLRALEQTSELESTNMAFEPGWQVEMALNKLICLKSILLKISGDVVEQWPGCLDEQLLQWHKCALERNRVLEMKLQISNLNSLLLVNMPKMSVYGHLLVKVELIRCDFVHAQCLNALGNTSFCPNMTELLIKQCGTVQDDLFVGEVPELCAEPFANLQNLTFQSTNLANSLATFLLSHSLALKCVKLQPSNEIECNQLRMLVSKTREVLEEVSILIKAEIDEDVEQIEKTLHTMIDDFEAMKSLEIITFDRRLEPALNRLKNRVREENLDLELKVFVVNRGRH